MPSATSDTPSVHPDMITDTAHAAGIAAATSRAAWIMPNDGWSVTGSSSSSATVAAPRRCSGGPQGVGSISA
jgi:hypothetical protein